jgi:hypothetical protein
MSCHDAIASANISEVGATPENDCPLDLMAFDITRAFSAARCMSALSQYGVSRAID